MQSKVDKSRKKTGGRTKGTPNKKTSSFQDALESQGFSVPESMVKLFNSTQDDRIKLSIIELSLKYSLPVPKPKEENPEDSDDSLDEMTDVSNDQLIKIFK